MSKRGENIYKRKDKRWEGRLKIGLGCAGKPVFKSVYAHSYLECKQKLRLLSQNSAPMRFKRADCQLIFADECRQWLAEIKPAVKVSTYALYHYIVEKYINAYLGEKKAVEVTKETTEHFIRMLRENGAKGGGKGLSVKTINNILTVLKSVCSFAEKKFAIENPLDQLRFLKPEERDHQTLSEQDWKKIAAHLAASADQTAAAVAIGMYTGMRIGELCALQKKDMDFDNGIIYVRRTIQRVQNTGEAAPFKTRLIVDKPKSAKSARTIPMPDILLDRLKTLCMGKKEDAFILGIDDKKPLEPRTLQYRFKSLLKTAGVQAIHFHALRHTFATKCIEKSMDIKSLSEILGHSSVKITLEKYVHSSMDFKRMQMNRLSEMI